jgi:enoyl-CoA hydratase/3-hydroxyacyl-CoA dehydrogenase
MKLVEITKGAKSSDEAAQIGYELAKKMKKVPVIVHKDSPGFIFNRVNEPSTLLLSLILQAGKPTPEEFDAAMKPLMPMTPFELMDYVGIDIAYNSLLYFSQVLSAEYKPSAAMDALLKAGTLGKKTGKGVYDWSAGRPTIDLTKATKEYDINHLIATQVNEATKVLAEGVAESAAEIDLALANGGGSPFGPFTLAQSIGYPVLLERLEDLYKKFKLEVFKPTELMKKGDIKV